MEEQEHEEHTMRTSGRSGTWRSWNMTSSRPCSMRQIEIETCGVV